MVDPTTPPRSPARSAGSVLDGDVAGLGDVTSLPVEGRLGARRHLARLLMTVDVAATLAAALSAGAVREVIGLVGATFTLEILPTLALVPLLVGGFAVAGCYRPAGAGLGADTFRRYVRGVGFNVLVVAFASFALRLNLSRLFVILLAGFLLFFGLAFRWLLRQQAHRPEHGLATRIVVAGSDPLSCRVATKLDGDGPSSFEVVGFLHTGGEICPGSDDCPDAGENLLGTLADLPEILARFQPDAVLASASSLSADDLRELYILLEGIETELIVYPSLVEVASRRLDIETVGQFPLLHLSTIEMTAGRRAVKRTLDLTVATFSLLLALPVLLLAALAIRLDSRGPVMFRQDRVGLGNKEFTLYKLRTMVQDAEDRLDDLLDHNEVGDGLFKMRDDPRITRVGGFLRRWSIDELPQLLNVLLGHMSLIGPRPALPREVDLHDDETVLRRHRLKPGITGYWQVSGRSDVSADEALRMDLYYVENWSLAFDVLILAHTVRAVLTSEGAY